MKHTLPDGLNLYYEIRGNLASNQSIIFLGGLSQSTNAWEAVVSFFEKQYKLILIDLIFQGQSDEANNYRSFEQHATDIHHLIESLKLPKIMLVGISYGGAVAMRYLVKYPKNVEKSVLISTFAYKNAYFDAIGYAWEQALKIGDYPLMLDVMLPTVLGKTYFEHPSIPIEDLKKARVGRKMNPESLLKLMTATKESKNYLQEMTQVNCPTLVIHGEEDILCTPEMGTMLVKALRQGSLAIIPKAGHTLNLEAVEPMCREIIKFLDKK